MGSRNLDAYQDDADILEHELRVDASRYIEVDKLAIPTGRFTDVAGTPLDFKTERKVGASWEKTANLIGEGMHASRIFFSSGFYLPIDLFGIKDAWDIMVDGYSIKTERIYQLFRSREITLESGRPSNPFSILH